MLRCCFLLLPSIRMMNKHNYRCGRHIFLLAFPTVLYCKKLWLILTTNLTQGVLVDGLTIKDLADVPYYAKFLSYPSFLHILLLRRLTFSFFFKSLVIILLSFSLGICWFLLQFLYPTILRVISCLYFFFVKLLKKHSSIKSTQLNGCDSVVSTHKTELSKDPVLDCRHFITSSVSQNK